MNNPMQQSLSPGSGPPIAKKQRGGATPGSIRSRPRPPTSSREAPPPVSENVVDDAIARRRAELRRLQERREAARKRTAKIKADMLNGGNTNSATTTALATTASAASQPTPQRGIIEARTSDIFPTAPKSPSLIPKPGVTRRVMASQGVPPIPNSTNNNRLLKASSSANPNLPPETPIQNPAPNTPAVGRKLEFPSGQKMAPGAAPLSRRERLELSRRARSKSPNKSPQSQESSENKTRAKSVPPRRPPGPPPRKVSPEKASLDGENSTAEEQQKTIAPPPVSAPSPTNNASTLGAKELARKKIQARRPKPVRPGSLLPTAKTKSPRNEEAEATSNPINKSNSFGSESGSSSRPKSKLPSPKKSPPKSPKAGPPVTKSSGPPSNSTSGPPPTATAATTSSSRPTSPPIMPISEGSTLDTSNLTPKTQRPTIGFGSGADTPPSSGSSARRQKLQAMREQALVAASTVAKATAASTTSSMNGGPPTPTSTNKAPSPSISSFYTSSGAPATAAFARAISTPKTNQKEASPPNLPNLNRINRDLPSAEGTENIDSDKDSKIPSSRKPPKASSSKSKSKLQSHAQARLEGAYNKSEQENVALLAKIKDLEDKLSQKTLEDIDAMKEAQQKQKLDIDRLLHLADTQGPEAAVQWVQSNVGSNGGAFLSDTPMRPASQKGFNPGMGATPMKGGMGMGDMGMNGITPSRRRIAIRALRAAQLGDNGQQLNDEPPEVTERRLIRKFREAAKHVAFEFSTDQATYFVRRPYGIPTEEGLFDHLRPPKEAPDAYARRAHVSDKNTVDVACIAKADNTPLLVFGSSGIRYQTNPSSKNVPPDFVHIPDVDALDRPLGNINYIDGQANEKQYSLDELLEEALLVREQYCGTLTSTALALPDPQQQQPSQDPQAKDDAAAAPKEGEKPQKKQEQQQQQPPPQQKYDDAMDSGSSDVLVDFLGLVVSFFFNLIWGIFIGLPLRIAKTTIVVVAVAFILQYLHIYLAMDHNKWLFESGLAYTTADMAYYSNQLPGVM